MPGTENALTWNEALNECRSANGIRPDLASIVDQYQMCKCSSYNLKIFNKSTFYGLIHIFKNYFPRKCISYSRTALITTQLKTITPGVWIGGQRGTEGAFLWVNNDPFQYSNWANSYPDTNLYVSRICCFDFYYNS